MKIKEIRAVPIELRPNMKTQPRVPMIENAPDWVSPMLRYAEYQKSNLAAGGGNWSRTACIVTADDGTWGLGLGLFSGPIASIINDHIGPVLEGQNAMATEKCWDIMRRTTAQYGAHGLASYAISAVDNALWDLKGKLLNRPVMSCWAVRRRTRYSATPQTLTSRMAERTASRGSWRWGSKP